MKIYIAGKITGEKDYKERFKELQEELEKQGHIVLNPSILPQGMSNSDYMKICFAMIDVSDEVVFMKNWKDSHGACLENDYCLYTKKKINYERYI